MHKPSIALRLLWKEWTRAWPLLAGGVLVSQLAAPMMARDMSILSLDVSRIVLFVLATALVVRAATLGAEERDRRSYAGTHFPLHPARGTLFTFLFHLLVAMVLGLGFGWHFALQADLAVGALLVLFVTTIYLISFIASLALSTPAGIVAGLLWTLLAGTTPFHAITPRGGYQLLADEYNILGYSIYFVIVTVLAPLSLIPLLAKRANAGITRRVIATALLAMAILLLPVTLYLGTQVFHLTEGTISERLTTLDGALTVKHTITLTGAGRTSTLEFRDYRRRREVQLKLPAAVLPVGLVGKEAVILLQQQPGKRRMEFLHWDVERNTTTTLLDISARGDALAKTAARADTYGFKRHMMALSPDGRFALVVLPACFGLANQYDLWLIDFDRRQADILRTSNYQPPSLQIIWNADRALLDGEGLQVDLARKSIKSYTLPAEERP